MILDASWVSAEERAKAAGVAEETGTELLAICCTCEESIGAERIQQRLARGEDVSEATVAVRNVMEAGMDPWRSAAAIDTSHTAPSVNVERALRTLSR